LDGLTSAVACRTIPKASTPADFPTFLGSAGKRRLMPGTTKSKSGDLPDYFTLAHCWIAPCGRGNLTNSRIGFLRSCRWLIRDLFSLTAAPSAAKGRIAATKASPDYSIITIAKLPDAGS
jgi:hypothetical protein